MDGTDYRNPAIYPAKMAGKPLNGISYHFCRKSKCDKPASHVLYYFEDGMRYSIRHCKEHLDWAKDKMNEFFPGSVDKP